MARGEETWREASSIEEASRIVGCIYRKAGKANDKVAEKALKVFPLVCIDERGVGGYHGNTKRQISVRSMNLSALSTRQL